jgi:hypothetical protein
VRSIHDGRLKSDQGQLFYEFRLGDAVPEDYLVRKIDAALDLSWLRNELASRIAGRATATRSGSVQRVALELRRGCQSRHIKPGRFYRTARLPIGSSRFLQQNLPQAEVIGMSGGTLAV